MFGKLVSHRAPRTNAPLESANEPSASSDAVPPSTHRSLSARRLSVVNDVFGLLALRLNPTQDLPDCAPLLHALRVPTAPFEHYWHSILRSTALEFLHAARNNTSTNFLACLFVKLAAMAPTPAISRFDEERLLTAVNRHSDSNFQGSDSYRNIVAAVARQETVFNSQRFVDELSHFLANLPAQELPLHLELAVANLSCLQNSALAPSIAQRLCFALAANIADGCVVAFEFHLTNSSVDCTKHALRLLPRVASFVSETFVERAWKCAIQHAVRHIQSHSSYETEHFNALSKLAARLPETRRQELLHEYLSDQTTLDDTPLPAVVVCLSLAPFLSEAQRVVAYKAVRTILPVCNQYDHNNICHDALASLHTPGAHNSDLNTVNRTIFRLGVAIDLIDTDNLFMHCLNLRHNPQADRVKLLKRTLKVLLASRDTHSKLVALRAIPFVAPHLAAGSLQKFYLAIVQMVTTAPIPVIERHATRCLRQLLPLIQSPISHRAWVRCLNRSAEEFARNPLLRIECTVMRDNLGIMEFILRTFNPTEKAEIWRRVCTEIVSPDITPRIEAAMQFAVLTKDAQFIGPHLDVAWEIIRYMTNKREPRFGALCSMILDNLLASMTTAQMRMQVERLKHLA